MPKHQQKQPECKVTLNIEVDGRSVSYPVGVDLLRDMISRLPDNELASPLLEILAGHPAAGVRQDVTRNEQLPESAFARLSEDGEIEILRNLCSNQKFRRCAREDLILQLIVRDRDCAETIASCLEDFQNCDADALIEAFMSSADPERRWLLVRNSSLSAKLRKQLAMDPDPSVAAEANRRLTERY